MKRLFGFCLLALAVAGMMPGGTYLKQVTAARGGARSIEPLPLVQSGLGDGDLVVSQPNTVINRYAILAMDVSAGASSLLVTYPGGDHGLQPEDLSPGDVILVVQMAGATIDTSDSPKFGEVRSLNQAGLYEYLTIHRVDGGLITVRPPCGGVLNHYTASARVQVIRVPRYRSLTVAGGSSIVAPPWNGNFGGIVAALVEGQAVIHGEINVSGRGFRGGELSPLGGGLGRSDYLTGEPSFGAEKGEGIAGEATAYDALGGRYGRGAAANGGGGGTAHNAGGGGGANGSNGAIWTGQGVMDSSLVGGSAWALDPAYIAGGGELSRSSGGGRGGYSYAVQNADALIHGPGDTAWQGDGRREVGGLGGRPVPQDPSSRLFLGGGGGAGAQNDFSGGVGGAGGGMIYLIANTISGTGQLLASGQAGGDTHFENRDGAGGGGAGGTIVVVAGSLNGLQAKANGGRGGVQRAPLQPNPEESQGPGGGGGGGFIAYTGGVMVTEVSGGAGGFTESPSLAEFPANGATAGATGSIQTTIDSIPFCQTASDVAVTIDNSTPYLFPGVPTTYQIVVRNFGPAPAYTVRVQNILPPIFENSSKSWTCQPIAGASCAVPSGTGDLITTLDLASGGIANLTVTAALGATSSVLSVTNQVVVALAAGAIEVNPANNTASVTNQVNAIADLQVTKTAMPKRVFSGGMITYDIVVRNLGPDPALGATVEDMIAPELLNPRWTCAPGVGASCTPVNGTGRVATTVDLPPGGSVTIRMEAGVSPLAMTKLSSQTIVTPGFGTQDPDLSNNMAETKTEVLPSGGTTIFASAGQTELILGQELLATLGAESIFMGVFGQASRRNQTLVFPVASGGFHLPSGRAEIGHRGGILLVKGSVQLFLSGLCYDTTGDYPILTGHVLRSGNPAVGGEIEMLGRMTILTLTVPPLPLPYPPSTKSVYVWSIASQTATDFASLLNSSFGTTRFQPNAAAGGMNLHVIQQ
jgi:uncharacterized repeat protein (TIGR01451 family)